MVEAYCTLIGMFVCWIMRRGLWQIALDNNDGGFVLYRFADSNCEIASWTSNDLFIFIFFMNKMGERG